MSVETRNINPIVKEIRHTADADGFEVYHDGTKVGIVACSNDKIKELVKQSFLSQFYIETRM